MFNFSKQIFLLKQIIVGVLSSKQFYVFKWIFE